MLSEAKYHLKVPKDYQKNLEFRTELLQRAAADVNLQRGIVEMCRQDMLFYVNTFVWQFNPTKKGAQRVGPFISWPCQDRILLDRPETTGRRGMLWCYENDKSGVCEKSREMGMTWWFLILEDWLCLFHEHVQAFNVSKSADAVDCKSKNSLFEKIRFMHEHLPDWLKGKIVEEKMFFSYERTGAEQVGEASTGRAGVGGRFTIALMDEFSEVKEDVDVRQKTASTGSCRFFVSTHLGTGTEFYNITQDSSFVKFNIHWTQHPDKNKGLYSYDTTENKLRFWRYDQSTDSVVEAPNTFDYPPDFEYVMDGSPTGGFRPGIRSPWYDAKCLDIGSPRGVAMQLDINPLGSVSQFYNPIMIKRLKQFCEPAYFEGNVRYDKDTAEVICFEPSPGGPLRMWLSLRDGMPPNSRYGAGADVAGGAGCTPSCLSIADARTGKKVMEYMDSSIDPKEFGVLSVALCRAFCDENGVGAKLCWEQTGPGGVYGKKIWEEHKYYNIYYKTTEMQLRQSVSDKPGWNPTKENARILHEDYRSALNTSLFLNPSERALDDCLSFKYTSDGRGVEHSSFVSQEDSGSRENHGDIPTADALSYKMIKAEGQARSKPPEEENYPPPGSSAWREMVSEEADQPEFKWA